MSRKVIIIIIIIVAVGVGLYFLFGPERAQEEEKTLPLAPPVERHEYQGMEYEIISVGGPVYDIITGELTEEQVNILAEKVNGDIIAENPAFEEITLLFYSDLIAVGVGDVDVAEIVWMPEGINVKIMK